MLTLRFLKNGTIWTTYLNFNSRILFNSSWNLSYHTSFLCNCSQKSCYILVLNTHRGKKFVNHRPCKKIVVNYLGEWTNWGIGELCYWTYFVAIAWPITIFKNNNNNNIIIIRNKKNITVFVSKHKQSKFVSIKLT